MAKMETISRTHEDRKRENRNYGDKTIFGHVSDALHWLNEPAKNKYTLGAAARKVLRMEPSEHGFHTSRVGRLVERASMVAGAWASIVLLPPPVGVLVGLACTKAYSMGAGALVAAISTGLEGTMRKLDRKFRKPDLDIDKELDRVGVRRGLQQNQDLESRFSRKRGREGDVGVRETPQEVGARETPQMQRPEDMVGVREFKEASIQTTFQTVASRTFDPAGPRPRENFDLPGNKGPKSNRQGIGA